MMPLVKHLLGGILDMLLAAAFVALALLMSATADDLAADRLVPSDAIPPSWTGASP